MDGGAASVISLPSGGGALAGIGETFAPDLQTGTGNFTVPLAVPPGRNGLQPQLQLVYSSGNGNGPFGLGWSLSLPGITRQTAKGVPRYDDERDAYLLSGAEDLVPVEVNGFETRYRPRTEGLYARILHHRAPGDSHWQVSGTDGVVTTYGTPGAFPGDPATVADPADRSRIFSWAITRTADPFGNHIAYEYRRDSGQDGAHHWDQLYIERIRYIDHGDTAAGQYLVSVAFEYEPRPDPFSGRRAGFEVRTRLRCSRIVVRTHADGDALVRTYALTYVDELADGQAAPPNGVSLLARVHVTGHDGERIESLPPLEFGYGALEPGGRTFVPVQGTSLPVQSLASPDMDLVDIGGNGLPDIVELGDVARHWRNLGGGCFDVPRPLTTVPAGLRLSNPGVQFIDANGDGRPDLMVTNGPLAGYFPMCGRDGWDGSGFRRFRQVPPFDLTDPEVRLVDLDGDGVTDAIRAGTWLECFFNDPVEGWSRTRTVSRGAPDAVPDLPFSDTRVRWGDFTGDGLQDVAVIHDRNVEYWPSLGHGDWGPRIAMRNAPRLPFGYDPARVLVGDVDGDGLADLVYVGADAVTLWINRGGEAWSDPIAVRTHGGGAEREFRGTPPVADGDVRLADLLGSGIDGVLWSRDAQRSARRGGMYFLDFTGGHKPYLLERMDNHAGAVTVVEYAPSTRNFAEDDRRYETPWRTSLPFPVHVVARVSVSDHFSGGTLSTRYRYRHGHWDGLEREFRGFAMVEQHDAEVFDGDGPAPDRYAPPTLTRTWFHIGPLDDGAGGWMALSLDDEFWAGDANMLPLPELPSGTTVAGARHVRRDALRALRGSVLRREVYALDGSAREGRPYTVTESACAIEEIEPPATGDVRRHIFHPHVVAARMTQWERGDDPLTSFTFTHHRDDGGAFDPFGRVRAVMTVGCPRGWRTTGDRPAEGYLARYARSDYAVPAAGGGYLHNRVSARTEFEVTETAGRTVFELAGADFRVVAGPSLRLDGQTLTYYDGPAWEGLPRGEVGPYGIAVRSAALVLTPQVVADAYGDERPPWLVPEASPVWSADYPPEFRSLLAPGAGYAWRAAGADPLVEPEGWFVQTARRRFDFHGDGETPRGLLLETRDALWHPGAPGGHHAVIDYDAYGLLPVRVTDAAGLVTEAANDYRTLRPHTVTDPNGGSQHFTFTPLGFLEGTYVRGRTADEGDQSRPGTHMEYDFGAFDASPPGARQPLSIRTIRQVYYDTDTDVPAAERDETITTVEYTDGFGRLLQTRTQGEDVRFGDAAFGGGAAILPLAQADGAGGDVVGQSAMPGALYVVVSGWQVYDNKGRAIEAYEPFFSSGWGYRAPGTGETGRSVRTFYDPLGRSVRTVQPDGSEQRAVPGVPGSIAAPDLAHIDDYEPTPWEVYTYDANDNAGRTHPGTSGAFRHHHDTPSSAVVDALGRTVTAVVRQRQSAVSPIAELRTGTVHDSRGNVVEVVDAAGRVAFRTVYDLANRPLRVASIDAGTRTSAYDAAGGLVECRDARGGLMLQLRDGLNRPVRTWACEQEGAAVTLVERTEYGDGGSPDQPALERMAARLAYRLGEVAYQWDGAGRLTCERYDIRGALVQKTRQVLADAALLATDPFPIDWSEPETVALDAGAYATVTEYDALGRVHRLTLPEQVDGARQMVVPRYNRAGALECVALERHGADGARTTTAYLERIAYDAQGQRTLVAWGNGTMTRYAYDPNTGRLARLRTERYTSPDDLTYHPNGAVQQDFAYGYDLMGNVLAIHDRTPGSGIPGTVPGIDGLDRSFAYDPLYRLLSATGRECDTPPDIPWDDVLRSTDVTRSRAWTETYRYDAMGNLTELRHASGGTASVRTMRMAAGSNRLHAMTAAGGPVTYLHDAAGNLVQEGTSRHFDWDHAGRLRGYRTQAGGGPPSVGAQYLYDAAGQRVKKLVRAGGRVTTTVYIDGMFERCRTSGVGPPVEHDIVHVMDEQRRVATVRVGAAFPGDATPAVQYHLGDHLGSSNVVLDAAGAPVSREEYTPYGETAFGGHARKRYRYSGKERDEESGLCYFGFRYYAPWLARWTAPDPAGPKDGPNLYCYVADNPVRFIDPAGLQSSDPLQEARKQATGHGYNEQFVNSGDGQKSARMSEGTLTVNGEKVLPPVPPTVDTIIPGEGEGRSGDSYTPETGPPRPTVRELREERWEAAKSGMKNAALDLLQDSLPIGTPSLVKDGLEALKDAPPAATGDTIRDLELQESFEGGQIVTNTVAISATMLPVGEIAQGARAATNRLGLARRTYITYVFTDAPNSIRYVGRASGVGTPEQVLYQRLLKGHHVFLAHESLVADVWATHSSRDAAMGAESVFHDTFRMQGYNLLNSDPPLGTSTRRRLAKTRRRIEAFFADW